MSAAAVTLPSRAVLDGVPKIGYHIHMCPFPGSLWAAMQYLGDPCDYDELMGVTGAAFRRLWNRDDGGNVDLMYLAPEPERRAFAALGYSYYTVARDDREAIVAALRESIAAGRPAIAFGIVGPPEAGLLTGYDRDGDVVYGYSYFQDDSEPGTFAREGWFDSLCPGPPYGLLVIGERTADRPPRRALLADAISWAVDLARSPRRAHLPEHVSGLAAYEAWAAGLEVDADYPARDAEVLQTRLMVHADQVVMLAERRSAASFLRTLAPAAPEAVELLEAAAARFDAVASYEPHVWHWGYSMGPEVAQALADPAARRSIAAGVRSAAAEEEQAVVLLQRALAAMRAR